MAMAWQISSSETIERMVVSRPWCVGKRHLEKGDGSLISCMAYKPTQKQASLTYQQRVSIRKTNIAYGASLDSMIEMLSNQLGIYKHTH